MTHISKYYKFLIIFIFVIVITSNINSPNDAERNEDVKRLKALNDESNPSEDVPLYDKVEFVSLETNDKCLINSVKKVLIRDSLIYILDSSPKLFVFERKGHFKHQIGNKGQGPAEYITINSFFIDESEQCVVIIDDMRKAFLYYDFNGNYKQKKDVPWELITMIDKASMIGGDQILLNYCILPEDLYFNLLGNFAYKLIKAKNMQVLDSLSYNPIKATGAIYPFSTHTMTETEKGFNFIMPVCDTIFNCQNEKFSPKYIVEHKMKMAPKEQFFLGGDNKDTYASLSIKFGKKNLFAGFNGLFETDNHILLSYYSCYNNFSFSYFLANKTKREGRYFLLDHINETSKSLPILNNIISCDKSSFVSILNMNMLNYYKEVLKNNRNEGVKQFKEAIKNIDEEDNPILIFYYIKEDF